MPGRSSPRRSLNTMKILLIEDDKKTGDYIITGLKEAAHIIDLAKDGYEAHLG